MSIQEIVINIICFFCGVISGIFSLAIVSAGPLKERTNNDEF